MQRLCILLLLAAAAYAEVIDRIAVVVGGQVITLSQIDSEIRLSALQNGSTPDFGRESRGVTSERLIEQMLLRREMEASRYPQPAYVEGDKMLAQFRQDRFPTPAAYDAALKQYGVSEDDLRQHLLWQLATVRFVDFRFRPGVRVSRQDVRDFYENEYRKNGSAPAEPFVEAREKIEEILTERLVDQALERWINQQRTQTRIQYSKEALP